jgi:hypothetical protein
MADHDASAIDEVSQPPATPAGETRIADATPPWHGAPATRIADAPHTAPVGATRIGDAQYVPPTRFDAPPPPVQPGAARAAAWARDWRKSGAVAAVLVVISAVAFASRGPSALEQNSGDDIASGDSAQAAAVQTTPSTDPARNTAADHGPEPSQQEPFKLPEIAKTVPVGPAPSSSSGPKPAEAKPAPTREVEKPVEQKTTEADSSTRVQPPPAPPPVAESNSVGAADVRTALAQFTGAVSGRDTIAVERMYANAGAQDAQNLKQLIELMREGALQIDAAYAGGPLDAQGGRARIEVDATARWRTPFGANRRRDIKLAIEIERAGARWRLANIRVVGRLQ